MKFYQKLFDLFELVYLQNSSGARPFHLCNETCVSSIQPSRSSMMAPVKCKLTIFVVCSMQYFLEGRKHLVFIRVEGVGCNLSDGS